MTKLNIGILFGGCSGEHEVSLVSAQAIVHGFHQEANASRYTLQLFYIQKDGQWCTGQVAQDVLDSGKATIVADGETSRSNRWMFPPQVTDIDVWFPVLHGPNGEDGTIQGLLALMQVPYVGSGVLGSAAGMDKIAMKTIFAQAGLPQVPYIAVNRAEVWSDPCRYTHLLERIEGELDYPCFVKPANLGSSVGVAKVRNPTELAAALDSAASYDRRIIVEAAAGPGIREVECAVLGNDFPKASMVGEITYTSDFYDYETKYTAGRADLIIPADIPPVVMQQIQEMALQAFSAVDASGLARVDFFYVEARGKIFLNEINTMPGFTAMSMYPRLWEATHVPFEELVHRLVQFALERHIK